MAGKSPLRRSFDKSLKSAAWLTPADLAQVELARLLITRLDSAVESTELVNLARTLDLVLSHLGLNIAGRNAKADYEKEGSPLDELKRSASNRVAEAKTSHSA